MPLIHRVIARLNVGGPAMHVVNLARGMNDGPWRTRLVAGSIHETEGDMTYYARERGVDVVTVPELARAISPLDDLRTLVALYRLFRKDRPDIVHTHTAKAGTLGRLAAILAGVPVRIHTFHGHVLGGGYFSPAKTRFFLEVERQLARATQRLVVLTERQAHEMSAELGVAPRERFAVVPLGLELERFAEEEGRPRPTPITRASLGIGDDRIVVGIVGRMVPIKNHELYLRALAALRGRVGDDVMGMVVGAGEREGELQALAADLGLEGSVLWMGWRRDLDALYPLMDVVALTSHDEGTPVALLEALAAGVRVAARDVGGVAELLATAGAGTVVAKTAGPERWAAALETVLQEPPPPPGVQQGVVERFSVVRLVDDVDRLYRVELARAGLWASGDGEAHA